MIKRLGIRVGVKRTSVFKSIRVMWMCVSHDFTPKITVFHFSSWYHNPSRVSAVFHSVHYVLVNLQSLTYPGHASLRPTIASYGVLSASFQMSRTLLLFFWYPRQTTKLLESLPFYKKDVIFVSSPGSMLFFPLCSSILVCCHITTAHVV